MSKILSKTFFSIILVLMLCSSIAGRAFAQCDLTTTQTNDITTKETPGSYQYVRTSTAYEAVSIKSGSRLDTKGYSYYLSIEYTSQTATSVPVKLLLKLSNGQTVALNVRFAKNVSVDDKRTSAKTLEAKLTEQDIASLTASTLSKISFKYIKQITVPAIPVADGSFLQAQLACLKATVK